MTAERKPYPDFDDLSEWHHRLCESVHPDLPFPCDCGGIARIHAKTAAEIEQFADDHSDVSDAYRHAALIAKGTPPA